MTTPSFFGYMLSPQLAVDQIWQVIETHEALVEEQTFTFSFPAITFDDVSMLVLTVDASPTSFVTPEIRINKDSSANYFLDGRDIFQGTFVGIDKNIQNQIQLCRNTNGSFAGMIKIFLEKATTGFNRPMTISEFNAQALTSDSRYVGRLNKDISSITDITILTSSPAFKIGSRYTLYKVLRK